MSYEDEDEQNRTKHNRTRLEMARMGGKCWKWLEMAVMAVMVKNS